jgi:oligopeptide/dipeptide ABC transporter ATP-binding protein
VNGSPLLEVDGLRVEFTVDRRQVCAVDDVSFAVDAGESLAIVGESGSGKSVTAMAVMGLVDAPGRVTAGDVRLDGRSLVALSETEYEAVRGRELAMVFQDPMTSLNPVMRVGDQVAEAITVHRRLTKHAASTRAVELLAAVGVADARSRGRDYPHQLSGGMRQRVMLAMAIANRPRVLIADEPTTALDVTTQAQIVEQLVDLQRRAGLALVLVTHDLGVVAGLADRVVVMYAGRVVEHGSADDVFHAPRHPYTRALLRAAPRVGAGRGSLATIPGSPPAAGASPAGCPFHPRCPFAVDRCRVEVPALEPVGDGHEAACLRVGELA